MPEAIGIMIALPDQSNLLELGLEEDGSHVEKHIWVVELMAGLDDVDRLRWFVTAWRRWCQESSAIERLL